MAEAKKKKALYIEPIQEITGAFDPSEIKITGWVFGRQNIMHNTKRGWKHWRPVKRDSELGEEIAAQWGLVLDIDATDNYFHFGPDTVLAYTSVELNEKKKASNQSRADAALAAVSEDVNISRHVVINKGPAKNPKEG